MNVILMRCARQVDEALLQDHLQTLHRAHDNLLVMSGRSACYAPVLALADSLEIQTQVFEQDFYDPQQVHGARKMDWLFDPYAGRNGSLSLSTLYHAFAIELEAIFCRHSESTLVIYLTSCCWKLHTPYLPGYPCRRSKAFLCTSKN